MEILHWQQRIISFWTESLDFVLEEVKVKWKWEGVGVKKAEIPFLHKLPL